MRGYFAIGVDSIKNGANIGGLWRSANTFGAAYIFTIGARYQKQPADVAKTPRHTPLFHYSDFDDFKNHLPHDCKLVGVEITDSAQDIRDFTHPERCVYLLGSEDHGLDTETLEKCHAVIKIPGRNCLNVAIAGSIVAYDRWKHYYKA